LAIDEGLRGPDRLSGQSDRVAKPGVEISRSCVVITLDNSLRCAMNVLE
jgi:hypothetical protein